MLRRIPSVRCVLNVELSCRLKRSIISCLRVKVAHMIEVT